MDPIAQLRAFFLAQARVLVAFSGGVDSGLLAYVAYKAIGDRALAVTGVSASVGAGERQAAEAFCRAHGMPHTTIATDEFANPNYLANRGDRCFHCKEELFRALHDYAQRHQYDAIIEGTNIDDLQGHRPGHQAAEEAGVHTPYVALKIDKATIRAMAHQLHLDLADKPAMACLASRIPVGISVDPEVLARIDRAEAAMRGLGFRQVRVRHHGDLARIEVDPADLSRCIEQHDAIVTVMRNAGYTHVTVDLQGYRLGGSFMRKVATYGS
jgi:pyridinium-3,5-biscarboxylic acid mononucleotide sulfurtransferase